jgi:hypothetical protein
VPRSDLAALGFLTVGRTFLGNANDIIDDRIDLVTRGLMGLTVACSRCHDHKYEPVSTADYYAPARHLLELHDPGGVARHWRLTAGTGSRGICEAKLEKLRAAITDHEAAVHARSDP